MENQNKCPRCGGPTKTVPAGVSKRTGKSYGQFEACMDRDCKPAPKGVDPRIEDIVKKLDQIIFLLIGSNDREELKKALEEALGRGGLLNR